MGPLMVFETLPTSQCDVAVKAYELLLLNLGNIFSSKLLVVPELSTPLLLIETFIGRELLSIHFMSSLVIFKALSTLDCNKAYNANELFFYRRYFLLPYWSNSLLRPLSLS